MEKKKVIIMVIALVIVSAGLAIGLVFAINGTGNTEKSYSIEGTWTEDSTGVEITIKGNGVFQILGNDAAMYDLQKEETNSGVLTLKYSQTYGGQTTVMHYTVGETKMTLTMDSTGEVQNYTRSGNSDGQSGQ